MQKQVDRAIGHRARRSKNSTEEDDEQNEFAEALPLDYRGVDDCARCDLF